MGAGNIQRNNMSFFKLKKVEDKQDKHDTQYRFFQSVKNGGNWELSKEHYEFIDGEIVRLERTQGEYKGTVIHNFAITLLDSNKMLSKVSFTFSNIGRSIINCLLGAVTSEEGLGLIQLTAVRYTSKANNGKLVDTVFVTNNGKRAEWKYSADELPDLEEIGKKKDGTKIFDDTDLNEFFFKKFDKLLNKVNSDPVNMSKLAELSNSQINSAKVSNHSQDEDDDEPVAKKKASASYDDDQEFGKPIKKKAVVEDDDDEPVAKPIKKKAVVEDDDDLPF